MKKIKHIHRWSNWWKIKSGNPVNLREKMVYWWYGYRHLDEIIRKKYNLGYRYIELLTP